MPPPPPSSSASPNPSIAHPLSLIDPYVDTSRNEGEVRMVPLRPLLRIFARSVNNMGLVDPESDDSFGALLASRPKADLGGPIVECILSGHSDTRAAAMAICLVRPTVAIISTHEADDLDNTEREKCIAILGDNKLARPTERSASMCSHVILTISKSLAGGTRDAKMDIERVSPTCVKIMTVSSSGSRRNMTSGQLPLVVVEKLFAVPSAVPSAVPYLGPNRRNELTAATKLAIVDFLERKVRLHVMCTASMPSPISRPIVLDRARLRESSKKDANWLSLSASLHPSSSSCICGPHGLQFECEGRVQVNIKTCGRPLQTRIDGGMGCPCHRDAIDKKGNARFCIDGVCTEGTRLKVECLHQSHGAIHTGVQIDAFTFTDADRLELSTILMNAFEFARRTRSFFDRSGCATDQAMIDRYANSLDEKLASELEKVKSSHLENDDAEDTNPRAMMQRDMIAVDLMRGDRVFRRMHKSGRKMGCPYLEREKNRPPLKPQETELAGTHGHLFRKKK